jgi:hypothetical protein
VNITRETKKIVFLSLKRLLHTTLRVNVCPIPSSGRRIDGGIIDGKTVLIDKQIVFATEPRTAAATHTGRQN